MKTIVLDHNSAARMLIEHETKTCRLCEVTTKKGYHWESHLVSDGHITEKRICDNLTMIAALEEIANSPEESHPANLLKMIARQALDRLEEGE